MGARRRKAGQRQEAQHGLASRAGLVGERRVRLRQERSDPRHVGLKPLQEKDFLRQVVRCLAGQADEKTDPDLVVQFAKPPDDLHPLGVRLARVDAVVERRVDGLVLQQVAVRAGLPERGIILQRPLADGQGNGRAGGVFLDAPDDVAEHGGRVMRVVAGLQDDGPDAPAQEGARGLPDFGGAHAVALEAAVLAAQSAVLAIAGAAVGELHDAAEEDVLAAMLAPRRVRLRHEIARVWGRQGFEDVFLRKHGFYDSNRPQAAFLQAPPPM